ncbi:MAG TPA: BON domain-containing protein [Lacipirellulaceae bacterium]|jgi:hypothetical protein|nr:BON domain-containing protein [Lacipirellulaceae bacterium]
MFGRNEVDDKALQKTVTQRLQRASSQAGLSASVQNGSVTLTGKLHFENQRTPIVKAMRSVAGVRNVIDQLVSPPKVRPNQPQQNTYRSPTPAEAASPEAMESAVDNLVPESPLPAGEISDPTANV